MPGPDAPMDPAKLRWRCRRGMRELDVLLERYLTDRWPAAGEAERAAFAELLELSDPDLAGVFLGKTPASGVRARVVADITQQTGRELSAATPVYPCDPAGGRLPGAGP
jgi:antitoxin CptB